MPLHTEQKLLTVTVPCYNSQEYMEKCIDSLLVGGDRVEILIINDGSSDRTGEIADRYASDYPDIVRAIHQENGGHGEGINQGVRHARGIYFKTVDSDDALSGDFPAFLDALEACEAAGGVDLFVTNYYYRHADGKGDRAIDFSNAFPADRIIGWDETGHFHADQILMIHACTFRTALLKESGIVLPKKVSYEDNYFVYGHLRHAERLYYLNSNLYLYTIGREGQSMQDDVIRRRYRHELLISELMFEAFHLDEVESRRKLAYLRHELFIIIASGIVFARLNRTAEADADVQAMWARLAKYDAKWAHYFRRRTPLRFLCIPGRPGQRLVSAVYRGSRKIVKFN